jgi:Bacterial Ig-like domain (group 3)
VNVTVAPAPSGTGTPSGEVALLTSTGIGAGSFLLANGTVTGTTNNLPGGSYTVTAHYPGDATFAASDSPGVSAKVTPEASTATIAYELFDPNSGQLTNPNATSAVFGGSPSLLRINVTSQAGDACAGNTQGATGCPTGNVTLIDNGTALDGGTFALNSNGYAEDQVIDLPGGTHNLKVTYAGDSSFTAPSPATETVTISPVSTALTLAANPPTIVLNNGTTLIATLTAQNIYSKIGPTGTVTFSSGPTVVGTFQVSGAPDPTTHQVNIAAVVGTGVLPIGNSTFTAKYAGDSSYTASVSGSAVVDVLIPTGTAVTASVPTSQVGQSVTFTAKITPAQAGGPAISGNVQFTLNGSNFGNPVVVQGGQAQLTTTSLPFGSLVIGGFYLGDSNYVQSVGYASEIVSPITATTELMASSSSIQQGQSVTFTTTVTPAQKLATGPTGNVQFQVSGEGNSAVPLNASGQAVFTTSTFPVGSVTVTSSYQGDTTYSGSSAGVALTVVASPDFSIVANPNSITIAKSGQTSSTSLMLTAINGLTGTFNLVPQCANLPSESTCGVSPASVTFSSTMTTATVTLTVSTTAPSSVPAGRRFQPTSNRPGTIFAIGLFALLSLLGLRRGRRGIQTAFTVITFAALLTFAACGGGSSGGGGGGVHDPGTPVGVDPNASVSFTIGTATHAAPISINVQ